MTALHGRYSEAESLYQQAQTIWERLLGAEHPNVALILNNRAKLYRKQGRFAEAEPLYQRSIAIWEKAQGPEHLNVGNGLNNLALLLIDQGRYPEAEPLLRRALSIQERKGNPSIPISRQLSIVWLHFARTRAATRKLNLSFDGHYLLERSPQGWNIPRWPPS